MKGRKQKVSQETYLQRDRAEPEWYAGGQIFMCITENNFTNVEQQGYGLLERIMSPANLSCVFKKVCNNKGICGIDDIEVESFLDYLVSNKEALIQSILDGSYRPNPVMRVAIPKYVGKKKRQQHCGIH